MLRNAGSEEDLDSLGTDDDEPQDVARLDLEDEEFEDDDDGDVDEEDDEEDDDDQVVVASTDDEEESDETSLEDLLAKRAAARRGGDDSEEDVTEILEMSSEREPTTLDVDPPAGKVRPIRSDEFVCARCRLVKPRVQLADRDRGLCRDCV